MVGLVLPTLWKYVALAALAFGAYWYVWDTGRDFERSKWETAMAAEAARIDRILDVAQDYSEALAGQLTDADRVRSDLIRRLQHAARTSPNADRVCLDADGVMRLNQIGDTQP